MIDMDTTYKTDLDVLREKLLKAQRDKIGYILRSLEVELKQVIDSNYHWKVTVEKDEQNRDGFAINVELTKKLNPYVAG